MAIRRFIYLSFAAAGVAVLGTASSAVAQHAYPPVPAPIGHDVSGGLILSADDFVLGPGETLVEGDPALGIAPAPHGVHPHPHPMEGHQPMFHPGDEMGIGMPCPTCEPGHYGMAEALYVKHNGNGVFTRSPNFALEDEFDYEWAGRLTLGRRFDCVNGYEAVYTGPLEWEMDSTATAPGNNIGTFLTMPDPLNLAGPNIVPSAFENAEFQNQRFQAEMNSLELNRTFFGWDVAKLSLGLRSVLYEEEYNYTSISGLETGHLRQQVDNILIGPQIGLELYYPLSARCFVGSRVKGALFANFIDSETALRNNADVFGGSDDDVELAGMVEIGSFYGIRLTDCITATVGYDLWYLTGIATSYDQIPVDFEVNQGSTVRSNDEVLMHGVNAGIQINY